MLHRRLQLCEEGAISLVPIFCQPIVVDTCVALDTSA